MLVDMEQDSLSVSKMLSLLFLKPKLLYNCLAKCYNTTGISQIPHLNKHTHINQEEEDWTINYGNRSV